MSPQIHFDGTEAVSFSAVERPGTYPMRIDSVSDLKHAKETGDPMIEVYFRFVDDQLHKAHGRVIRNYMLSGKGTGFTIELWKKATGEDVKEVTSLDTDDLLGKELTCEIKPEEYEGQMRNKIVKIIG